MAKTVWIDLENSPHVPFFLPWIAWLEEEGHRVLLTARDLSQTQELLRLHGREFTAIGGHAAGGRVMKAFRSGGRARELALWARGKHIGLALGHGSRAQVLAGFYLGLPCLTFVDYEYVSLRLFGLCCRRVFVPEAVPPSVLRARGIPRSRLVSYPGFKEQVYLDPDRDRPEPASPPLILIRPPARRAHYHTSLSERLYLRLLGRLLHEASLCRVLFLPRYPEDLVEIRPLVRRHPHFEIQEQPSFGPALMRAASLVVSGGGTMVREAAVLGIRAASFFGGPLGGVDRVLAESGRLQLLRTEGEVDSLRLPGPDLAGPPEGASESPGARIDPLPETSRVREFLRAEVRRWTWSARG